ncbi:hypothetical protein C9439_02200 [archaeon SCG-AAA382B04]|nr:hypothetical protein C9439_02200 [archaeon SCG-AAA382B04]
MMKKIPLLALGLMIVLILATGTAMAFPGLSDQVVNTNEYRAEVTGFKPAPVNYAAVNYVEINESGNIFSNMTNQTTRTLLKARNNTVRVNITSSENCSQLISVTIAKEVLNVSTPGDIEVLFDNETITLANNLTDITSVDSNNPAQLYWVTNITENSSQVLIRNSNWSTHTIEITKAESTLIGGSIDEATSFLTQTVYGIPYWAIISIVLLSGILVYKREASR